MPIQEGFASKPPVDISALSSWKTVGGGAPILSADGGAVIYELMSSSARLGKVEESHTIVIRETRTAWSVSIPGTAPIGFSSSGRTAIIMQPQGALAPIEVGTSSLRQFTGVQSAKLSAGNSGRWLAYQLGDSDKTLVLRDLNTGSEKRWPNVVGYNFDGAESSLALRTETGDSTESRISLIWIRLKSGSARRIFKKVASKGDFAVSNIVFGPRGHALAFATQNLAAADSQTTIWYLRLGMTAAEQLVTDPIAGAGEGLRVAPVDVIDLQFGGNGAVLNFKLSDISPAPILRGVGVDVWNYKDVILQSKQLAKVTVASPNRKSFEPRREYAAAVRIATRRVVQVEHEWDRAVVDAETFNEDQKIVVHCEGECNNEWNWNTAARASVELVSTLDGARLPIAEGLSSRLASSYHLSPSGRYVVYFNPSAHDWFSYDIESGTRYNISHDCYTTWTSYLRDDEPSAETDPVGLAGWIKDDAGVLIYDQNNIWLLSLRGSRLHINLTGHLIKRPRVAYRVAVIPGTTGQSGVVADGRIVVAAFDRDTKDEGFTCVRTGQSARPCQKNQKKLLLEANGYLASPPGDDYLGDMPIKAGQVDAYVVTRRDASTAPNLYFTDDFNDYFPLSEEFPERQYNWLTAELRNWIGPDGNKIQGVLYKPENFSADNSYRF